VDDVLPRVPGKMMDMGFDHNNEFASLLKSFDADGVGSE